MRQTDISKFTDKNEDSKKPTSTKAGVKGLLKILATVLLIILCAGIIVAVSLGIYVFKIATEPTGIDLDARSLNLSSFIYTENEKTGEFEEYQTLYGKENRIWVDLKDMPKYMPYAVVAIEDKRFYKHHGVDWYRTGGAISALISGSDSYGGSTITQQLIKNMTDDNEVSLTRKIREIFRALNVEKEYTKDDIIEGYLNVVNFGNNAQGVEAASQLYFDKSISECSICECASIAGITQNPAKWNPLIYPENNKKRRETVLKEMYDQKYITKDEYDKAMKESETLKFVDTSDDDDEGDNTKIQNWYIDQMYDDLVTDLAKYYDLSEDAASDKLYTEGLKIYCAMDKKSQAMIEEKALEMNDGDDDDLECGAELIDFNGRVIACAGSSHEKDANLLYDRSSDAALQPGSSIKSVMAYPFGFDSDVLTYGSLVLDEPIENWQEDDYGNTVSGPDNAYGEYNGYMPVPEALSWSSNACAVHVLIDCGIENSFQQATENLGFSHLAPADGQNPGALSIGGMEGGVTVREMASAITYIGNGGKRYDPYTYYYVEDQKGNVLLDNRNNKPIQAYSEETAYIMNQELQYNVQTSQHSSSQLAGIDGWEITGKTGTTDEDKDIWFVGASPYAALAVWVGYDTPSTIGNTDLAAITWHEIMAAYLEGKEYKEFEMPSSVTTCEFCKGSGMLAASYCSDTATGYYAVDKIPDYCDGNHKAGLKTKETEGTEEKEETEETEEEQEITGETESRGGGGEETEEAPSSEDAPTEAKGGGGEEKAQA